MRTVLHMHILISHCTDMFAIHGIDCDLVLFQMGIGW